MLQFQSNNHTMIVEKMLNKICRNIFLWSILLLVHNNKCVMTGAKYPIYCNKYGIRNLNSVV